MGTYQKYAKFLVRRGILKFDAILNSHFVSRSGFEKKLAKALKSRL